jgi:hypothetical protein
VIHPFAGSFSLVAVPLGGFTRLAVPTTWQFEVHPFGGIHTERSTWSPAVNVSVVSVSGGLGVLICLGCLSDLPLSPVPPHLPFLGCFWLLVFSGEFF